MSETEHVLHMLRATALRFGGRLPADELLRICGRRRLPLPSLLEVERTLASENLIAPPSQGSAELNEEVARRKPSPEDARGWFLEAVRDRDLLSPERELELFRQLRRADEARRLVEAGALGADHAARWLEAGKHAADTVALANLRLVHWVARPFLHASDLQGDLLQQGYLGLHRAIELFDPDLGTKFSTYATYWVFQVLTRYLSDHGRTVRLPSHLLRDLSRLRKARVRLHAAGQLDRCHEAVLLAHELGLDEARMVILLQLEANARSLAATVDEDGTELADLVPDDSEPEPFAQSEARELQATLERCLADFDERTQMIVKLRFGLCGHPEHTLEEVGEQLGITRERVRQLEAKALERLRHPSRSRRLEPFLGGDG